MKIEWLFEAQNEFRDLLLYYRNTVGVKYARAFSDKVLNAVGQLEQFPEIGVLRRDTLMGKHGFRAHFRRTALPARRGSGKARHEDEAFG